MFFFSYRRMSRWVYWSEANYQGYRYDVHLQLRCHTFAVMHSVNVEGVCWTIIVTTVFYMHTLKHWMYKCYLYTFKWHDQKPGGNFILGISFYNSTRDKHLSKLLPILQFTLSVVPHFVQFSNTLYCRPIVFVQVFQMWIISFKDINRDSIWFNWVGLC